MSSTITYKGSTLTTVNNQTRTLLTSGKWLEDNITITDVTSGGSVTITDEANATGTTCVITSGSTPTPTPTPSDNIPLNTQLIDYTKCLQNTAIDSSGQEGTMEWYYASDYTPVAAGMTFTFTCGWWTNVAFYDSSKTFIRSFTVYDSDIAIQDEQDSNLGHGTLTGNTIPSNAAYIRMASTAPNSNYMSLIRTV